VHAQDWRFVEGVPYSNYPNGEVGAYDACVAEHYRLFPSDFYNGQCVKGYTAGIDTRYELQAWYP
jgi:hypothetical protein